MDYVKEIVKKEYILLHDIIKRYHTGYYNLYGFKSLNSDIQELRQVEKMVEKLSENKYVFNALTKKMLFEDNNFEITFDIFYYCKSNEKFIYDLYDKTLV